MVRLRYFIVTFLLMGQLCYSSLSEEFTLKIKDVKQTMEEMLSYHVENKVMTPLLIKRSLKIFIEQFDPDKIYFLKDEIDVFLKFSDEEIHSFIRDYNEDNLSVFLQLNHLIQRAILRSREIKTIQKEILLKEGDAALTETYPSNYQTYAQDEEALRQRIYHSLVQAVKSQVSRSQIKEISSEVISRIIDFQNKKVSLFEKTYLSEDESSHNLTLHILKAMAKSLDAHTGYYSPKEAFEIRKNLKKQFCGIGIAVREDFDGIFISDLLIGGPAKKNGLIETGDKLLKVNYQEVESLSFEQILDMLKGNAGSKVTLEVKKSAFPNDTIQVELARENIILNEERLAFTFEPHANGIIGKIILPAFYDGGDQVNAEKDLREALKALKREGNLVGLVIDMRENSGGFLTQAVKVAGVFVNGGLIVVSKYSDGEMRYARDIDGRDYYNGPLVLLTSKASASAAEIVAQALQDYGVALVVGDERTYGKGSMQFQTLTNEKAKTFFKVTVGRYYTISGRSPQVDGVKADIHVPTSYFSYNIGEKYLEFPLSNDQLDGKVFHSLKDIKGGSYLDISQFEIPYLKPR